MFLVSFDLKWPRYKFPKNKTVGSSSAAWASSGTGKAAGIAKP
jgi:hypothetical protein